jgi:hypothetical protein
MAKGQMKSNKEKRKPKKEKASKGAAPGISVGCGFPTPETRHLTC